MDVNEVAFVHYVYLMLIGSEMCSVLVNGVYLKVQVTLVGFKAKQQGFPRSIGFRKPTVKSFVLDCEIIAYDRENRKFCLPGLTRRF